MNKIMSKNGSATTKIFIKELYKFFQAAGIALIITLFMLYNSFSSDVEQRARKLRLRDHFMQTVIYLVLNATISITSSCESGVSFYQIYCSGHCNL